MKKNSHLGTGIALGMSLGFIFGLLLWDGNFMIGVSIGLCLGLVIGLIADERAKPKER
jgi:hypothetical protein